MGKNRILGFKDKTIGVMLLTLVLTSCSLPRIVILKDPLTPEEHINLGVSYEKNGEVNDALREYETASKELPIAYLYMGNIYFQKGDYENAEVYYKKVVRKTSDPQAYNNLAWLYYTTDKELERAEELARKAVELSPDSRDFLDTLNKILEKRRKY